MDTIKSEVGPRAAALYRHMARMADGEGNLSAKRAELAEVFGVDRATVSRWVRLLGASGYLKVTPQFKEKWGGYTGNLYTLLVK